MLVPPIVPSTLDSREIVDWQINPMTGAVFALCRDGTMWVRDGSKGAASQPWVAVAPIPPTKPEPKKETEDDATILV